MWTSDDELQNLGFGTDGSPGPCPPSVCRFPFKPLIAFSRLNVSNDSFLSKHLVILAFCSSTSVFYFCHTTCHLLRFKIFCFILAQVQHVSFPIRNAVRVDIWTQTESKHTCHRVISIREPQLLWMGILQSEYAWTQTSSKRRKRLKRCRCKFLMVETSIWNAQWRDSSECIWTKFAITQIWHHCSILPLWERNGQII